LFGVQKRNPLLQQLQIYANHYNRVEAVAALKFLSWSALYYNFIRFLNKNVTQIKILHKDILYSSEVAAEPLVNNPENLTHTPSPPPFPAIFNETSNSTNPPGCKYFDSNAIFARL
jgi:hypothetical protein